MKKSLFLLLLLAGFSAYALNNSYPKNSIKKTQNVKVKKDATHSISPIADLFSFVG